MFKPLALAVVAAALSPLALTPVLAADAPAAKPAAEQAAKFWPLFEQFQAEQNAVIDGQLKATQKYADSYARLTDADSMAYVNALLERDQKIHDIRVKWLAEFQPVLSPGNAARVIHIDRRLGLVAQLKLASQIPLVR